jgi:hypothetical protein
VTAASDSAEAAHGFGGVLVDLLVFGDDDCLAEDELWGAELVVDGCGLGVRVEAGVLPAECVFVAAAPDDPDPSEVSTRTVRNSRSNSAMTDASSTTRRRQYTDGGWDPTG